MKRGATISLKALKEAGFIEYEPDKFAPASRVQQMPKTVIKKQKSVLKAPKIDLFATLCEIEGIPKPETEYRFHANRKWRMDYAWPAKKVFLEVEGGVFSGGRHTRGKGFVADMEKYNAAAAAGWTLIRCVPDDLKNGKAIQIIKETMKL